MISSLFLNLIRFSASASVSSRSRCRKTSNNSGRCSGKLEKGIVFPFRRPRCGLQRSGERFGAVQKPSNALAQEGTVLVGDGAVALAGSGFERFAIEYGDLPVPVPDQAGASQRARRSRQGGRAVGYRQTPGTTLGRQSAQSGRSGINQYPVPP